MKCSEDAAMWKRFVEKERFFYFLAGLKIEFDQVQVQVLGKDNLPSLNETIALIRAEEGRRGVMIEPQVVDGSAMVSKNVNPSMVSKIAKMKITGLEQHVANNNGLADWSKTANNETLWCAYCKKPRHTREKCWKLHGKPQSLNRSWTAKSGQQRGHSQAT